MSCPMATQSAGSGILVESHTDTVILVGVAAVSAAEATQSAWRRVSLEADPVGKS